MAHHPRLPQITVATGEYLRENHKEIFTNDKLRHHFHERLFNGFDFDSTMLRIGSMNMLLHGVENPNVRYKDSLAAALEVQIFKMGRSRSRRRSMSNAQNTRSESHEVDRRLVMSFIVERGHVLVTQL